MPLVHVKSFSARRFDCGIWFGISSRPNVRSSLSFWIARISSAKSECTINIILKYNMQNVYTANIIGNLKWHVTTIWLRNIKSVKKIPAVNIWKNWEGRTNPNPKAPCR